MVNYCNKIFFVIFLILCPLQPVYGVESGGSMFPGSSLFKAIGALSSKVIVTPFIYLYKKICPIFQGNNVSENLGENLQVSRNRNNKNEPIKPEISKATRDYAARLSAIFPYCYNNIKIQSALNEALRRARENGFSDEHCEEINNCLRKNVDVNFCDVKGKNQLHIMLDILCRNSKKFDVERFENLLKRGVRLSPDAQGYSPLRVAMFIAHLKEQENKVDMHKYQTVLGLLINSVDLQRESNILLIQERREAMGYLDRVIEINRPSNDIVAAIGAAKANKGII